MVHQERFVYRQPKHTLKGKLDNRVISHGTKGLKAAQKGVLAGNANYELWYQDESEFHLHPHLTKVYMRIGKQLRVHSPGVNRK